MTIKEKISKFCDAYTRNRTNVTLEQLVTAVVNNKSIGLPSDGHTIARHYVRRWFYE